MSLQEGYGDGQDPHEQRAAICGPGWLPRERVVDDAPARPRQIAQPNTRALTDTPKTTH